MRISQLNERSRYNDNDTDWDMYDEDGNFLAQIAGEPSEESAIVHYNNHEYMNHESEELAAKAVAVTYYPKEGKSPHKKGTKKYNSHMAAMHAESLELSEFGPAERYVRTGNTITTANSRTGSIRSTQKVGDTTRSVNNHFNADGSRGQASATTTVGNNKVSVSGQLGGGVNPTITVNPIVKPKLNASKVREETEYSDKQIKMAFGILNDPRYRDGNYDGAYATIEKVAKGLARHPSVRNALKRANESINTNRRT